MITIRLSHLLERGVRIEAAEAVAIVQVLASSSGAPSIDSVDIDSAGGASCRSTRGQPTVEALAALLDQLLPAAGIPAALRYAVARGRGRVEAPPFASVAAFSAAVSRFERSDRADAIRALLVRARSVSSAPQPPSTFVELDDLPLVDPTDAASGEPFDLILFDEAASSITVPPARSRHRGILAFIAVAALLLSAAAGYFGGGFVRSLREAVTHAWSSVTIDVTCVEW